MGLHGLCSHPVLPKQAVTWGPPHGVSLRTMVMPSQPLLSPWAVPAGRDRAELGTGARVLLVPVPCWCEFLISPSCWTLCHPGSPSIPGPVPGARKAPGRLQEGSRKAPGRLMKLTQMCSCPGIWSISVRNLLPWSTNLCWVSSPSLQPLLWSCQGSLSCSLCTASATCRR